MLVAEGGPGAQVTIVDGIRGSLNVELCELAHNRIDETSFNSEQTFQEVVKLLLIRIILIDQVVNLLRFAIGGQMPKSAANVLHMNSIQLQITSPKELHLVTHVAVDASDSDTRHCAKKRSWKKV